MKGNTKRCEYTYSTTRNKKRVVGCRLGGMCPLRWVDRIFCSRRKRTATAIRDANEWVAMLKKAGITKFVFKELPEELRNKKILHKASDLNLIEKEEKDSNNVAVWKLR